VDIWRERERERERERKRERERLGIFVWAADVSKINKRERESV
jgi:hypothetical protein